MGPFMGIRYTLFFFQILVFRVNLRGNFGDNWLSFRRSSLVFVTDLTSALIG